VTSETSEGPGTYVGKKADTFTEAHYNVNTSKGGLVFPVLVG